MGQAPPLAIFWCSSHVSVPFRAGHASVDGPRRPGRVQGGEGAAHARHLRQVRRRRRRLRGRGGARGRLQGHGHRGARARRDAGHARGVLRRQGRGRVRGVLPHRRRARAGRHGEDEAHLRQVRRRRRRHHGRRGARADLRRPQDAPHVAADRGRRRGPLRGRGRGQLRAVHGDGQGPQGRQGAAHRRRRRFEGFPARRHEPVDQGLRDGEALRHGRGGQRRDARAAHLRQVRRGRRRHHRLRGARGHLRGHGRRRRHGGHRKPDRRVRRPGGRRRGHGHDHGDQLRRVRQHGRGPAADLRGAVHRETVPRLRGRGRGAARDEGATFPTSRARPFSTRFG